MSKLGKAAMVVGVGTKLVVKYGPQAKIAWENGGRRAAEAGTRRARSLTARRRAFAQAVTVVEGSVLKVAPAGLTAYVVFSGDDPIEVHPPQEESLATLVEHADLDRRERPDPSAPSKGLRHRR